MSNAAPAAHSTPPRPPSSPARCGHGRLLTEFCATCHISCTTCEGDGCLDCDQRGYELCDCCLSEPATSYDGETMVGERCARELALGDEATLDVTADTIPCAAVAS